MMIKKIEKLEEINEFVWILSQDEALASYSRMHSMAEVNFEIERALNKDSYDLIGYYKGHELMGVCAFYWIHDEKYVQTKFLLIKEDYETIADSFIDHIRSQLEGYKLMVGIPFSNTIANDYLVKSGYEIRDSCIVTEMAGLNSELSTMSNNIQRITRDNFKDYEAFHDQHAIPSEMYYNSKNVLLEIDRFLILGFKPDQDFVGSIFVKIVRNSAEVFACFMNQAYDNHETRSLLINNLILELKDYPETINDICYFISEDSEGELDSALKAGFKVKDTYRLFRKIL